MHEVRDDMAVTVENIMHRSVNVAIGIPWLRDVVAISASATINCFLRRKEELMVIRTWHNGFVLQTGGDNPNSPFYLYSSAVR